MAMSDVVQISFVAPLGGCWTVQNASAPEPDDEIEEHPTNEQLA
jgi:hypothetical protein